MKNSANYPQEAVERGRSQTPESFNMSMLLKAYLMRWWLIFLCAIIGGGVAGGYVAYFVPESYTAVATMYVYINNPNQVNYQYTSQSDLNAAARLMETYMVVIRSQKVMEAVAKQLDNKLSPGYIASTIRVSSVSGTEVMALSVTADHPQLAMDICNAVAEFAPEQIIRVVSAGAVEVIDYATLPAGPDNKGSVRIALAGALVGAMLACALITLLIKLDKRVHTKRDLEEHCALPVLAEIPDLTKRDPVHYRKQARAVRKDKSLSGTERRRLKKSLLLSRFTRPAAVESHKLLWAKVDIALERIQSNILLVTSAMPSEGKSMLSANLALVAAQDGRRVLLIDADLRKASKAQYFAVENPSCGLGEVLLERARLGKALKKEVRPGLDYLPSGSGGTYYAMELLHSPAMQQLLDALQADYDLIILDTPPINVVADTLVLTDQRMGAIMVVRSRLSKFKEVSRALVEARYADMNLLGVVLTVVNKANQEGGRHSSNYWEYSQGYNLNKEKLRVSRMRGTQTGLRRAARRQEG